MSTPVDTRKPFHLKLVTSDAETPEPESARFQPDQVQVDLFPMAKPGLLILSDASDLSADKFLVLLNEARPTFILDVRPTPHFEMARLNRRQVFEIFNQNHITYVDIAGLAGISSRLDANLNPTFLIDTINTSLKYCETPVIEGPILILCNSKDFLFSAVDVFPKLLLGSEKHPWDVYVAELSTPPFIQTDVNLRSM